MNNPYINVSHSRDFYRGKSLNFIGKWEPNTRYFNDEYTTSIVVYQLEDVDGKIYASALLGCKKTHISKIKSAVSSSVNNEPQLIIDSDNHVVGINPNDYWIYICGSLQGVAGESAVIVDTYADAVAQAIVDNIGRVVFVRESRRPYLVTGINTLEQFISETELEEKLTTKVNVVEGKQLSTEDYSTEEKDKLANIEAGSQKNVIEQVALNGTVIRPIGKRVDLNIPINEYSVKRITVSDEYSASYSLIKNGDPVGVAINIPKDKVIGSGEVKIATSTNSPYIGAKNGDKYIDLLYNDGRTHVYIPAKELSDIYTGSDYITVTPEKKIKLEYEYVKNSIQSDINISIDQVENLQARLAVLEAPRKEVNTISIIGSSEMTGDIYLDNKYFSAVDNRITFNPAAVVNPEVIEKVTENVIGKETDTIEDSTLLGIKNAVINLQETTFTSENVGSGLKCETIEVVKDHQLVELQQISIDIKDNSSIIVNDNGQLDIVWSI